MPKLITASIAVATMALIATLIAIVEERPKREPPPPPGPAAVFSLTDQDIQTNQKNVCHNSRIAPPPRTTGEGETSVSATADRAIYQCLFVHTRSGIIPPDKMPPDRVEANIANLAKAPAARQCRETAALSPKTNTVSVAAAEQIKDRVNLCYSSLPHTKWRETTPAERSEVTKATADLLAAYAYSYHRLSQENALECRAVYADTVKRATTAPHQTARQAVTNAENGRRQYCGCVLAKLGIKSDNPVRNRSC